MQVFMLFALRKKLDETRKYPTGDGKENPEITPEKALLALQGNDPGLFRLNVTVDTYTVDTGKFSSTGMFLLNKWVAIVIALQLRRRIDCYVNFWIRQKDIQTVYD